VSLRAQVAVLPPFRILGMLFFLSGTSSLILETLFTRLLSYTFGNTAYAASTVLAAFLGGLALGAYIIGKRVDRWRPSLLIYGTLELAIGFYALLVPMLFAGLTRAYVALHHLLNLGPAGATIVRFLLATIVIVVPSALMGGTLPALARMVAATRSQYRSDLDWLYSVNTFGAAMGALLATYILMPTWGVYGTLGTAFSVNVAIFLYTAWWVKRGSPGPGTVKTRTGSGAFDSGRTGEIPVHLSQVGDEEGLLDGLPDKSGETPEAHLINTRGARIFLLFAAFLTGMITLAYEVIWTHALAFLVGNAVYAFGLMLFTFLCGLAAGAHAVSRLTRNDRTWAWAFVVSQMLLGAVILLTLPLWNHVPELFNVSIIRVFQLDMLIVSALVFTRMIYACVTGLRRRWKEIAAECLILGFLFARNAPLLPSENSYFIATEAYRFFIAFGLLIIPAILMGVAFPSLLNLLNRVRSQAGQSVGSIYAVNTIGSILGSLLAGFVLLQWLGSYDLLRIGAVMNAALALAFFACLIPRERLSHNLAAWSAFAAILVAALLLPSAWDVRNLTRGTYVYFAEGWIADKVLSSHEDVQGGLTTVVQNGPTRTLLSNGKFQGNNSGEVGAQVRFIMIPALFTRAFDRALVIGLGTGNSLKTLAEFPFRRIDVAELAPSIVDAARNWFSDVNGDVMDRDPRVHLAVTDGRNHLLLSQDHYDLISIEVTSIWISGEGDIYNKEFYELCKARLTPDGVLQQWVQVHHMKPRDFFVVLNTAAKVFPHVAFFLGPEQGLLIASSSPLEIDFQRVQALERSTGILQQLNAIGAHSMFSMLGEVVIYDQSYREALTRLSRQLEIPEALVSRDVFPYLEYHTPKGNIVPGDFLLDAWFFLRLTPPTLPPDLTLRNLSDSEDRDLVFGLAYEDRGDFVAAVRHLNGIHGKNRACAQAEIAWINARKLQATLRDGANLPVPWKRCL
jgi:spermidine synthase